MPEGRLIKFTVNFLSPNGSVSEAIGLRCDVTSWDDQVDLFQTAFDTFRSVDVVVREVFHGWCSYDDALLTGRECWSERGRQLLCT